jgi:hypothetical protein
MDHLALLGLGRREESSGRYLEVDHLFLGLGEVQSMVGEDLVRVRRVVDEGLVVDLGGLDGLRLED